MQSQQVSLVSSPSCFPHSLDNHVELLLYEAHNARRYEVLKDESAGISYLPWTVGNDTHFFLGESSFFHSQARALGGDYPTSKLQGWAPDSIWPISVFHSPGHIDWSRDEHVTQARLMQGFFLELFFCVELSLVLLGGFRATVGGVG